MSAEPEAMAAQPAAPTAARTRPFYWSVRRELWEGGFIYLAPLAVSAFVLVGFLFSTIGLPHRRAGVLATMSPARQIAEVSQPYDFAATAIVVTSLIVAIAYCLGALHGERRDRSILFWKSVPVSDLTTVLAKATVPFVILPLVAAAVVLAVQLVMFAWVSAILLASGMNPFAPPLMLGSMTATLLYTLATQTLWYAPLYGWLLLVSGWTRRGAPFLWAFLPPLALSLLEKTAFNTAHLGGVLLDRLAGGLRRAFDQPPVKPGPHLPSVGYELIDPARFLSSADVWLGLVFAVACLAACVWQRRYRDPI